MKESEINKGKILMIGIGNCGRSDDGLGWKFVDALKPANQKMLELEYRYQLQVEDAELISHYSAVVFVDATRDIMQDGFEIRPAQAAAHYYYSSHIQSPETVLYLASAIFNKSPQAYILAITGVSWDLSTSMSFIAETHLQKALSYFNKTFLKQISIGRVETSGVTKPLGVRQI